MSILKSLAAHLNSEHGVLGPKQKKKSKKSKKNQKVRIWQSSEGDGTLMEGVIFSDDEPPKGSSTPKGFWF